MKRKKEEASVRLRRDNCGDLNQRLSYAGQNLPTCSRFRCKGGMLQVLYWRPIKPLDFKAIGWKYSEERDSGNSFWNLSKLSILLNVFIPLEMSWNLLRLYLHDVNGVGFKSFLFLINSFLLRKINLQIFFPFLSLLLSFQKKTKQQARFTARTEKKNMIIELGASLKVSRAHVEKNSSRQVSDLVVFQWSKKISNFPNFSLSSSRCLPAQWKGIR